MRWRNMVVIARHSEIRVLNSPELPSRPLTFVLNERHGFGLKQLRVDNPLELVAEKFLQRRLSKVKGVERERVIILTVMANWVSAGPKGFFKG
jgi:hypothetical protein